MLKNKLYYFEHCYLLWQNRHGNDGIIGKIIPYEPFMIILCEDINSANTVLKVLTSKGVIGFTAPVNRKLLKTLY